MRIHVLSDLHLEMRPYLPTPVEADVVVLDCPPGLSSVVEAVASVADVLLIPVVPEPLPFRALERYAGFLEETGAASPKILAPFLSMIDRRKPLHRRVEAETVATGPVSIHFPAGTSLQFRRSGSCCKSPRCP